MAAIFGRFSHRSEALLIEAQNLAKQLDRPVGSDMVLLAIAGQSNSLAANLLKSMGLNQATLVELLGAAETAREGTRTSKAGEMRKLLEEAIKLASRFRFSSVEIEHILFVICKDREMSGYLALREVGLDPEQIANRLSEWLFSVSVLNQQGGPAGEVPERGGGERERFDIERYVFDVTAAAQKGDLDPVIGREAELEQLIHILLRRRKNNPLLLGEPGVGKTAVVDALAQRIAHRAVPSALIGKRVLTLDLSLVVAGTMYRGQFEERLKSIIQEVQTAGDCILFIDEIHTLTGTGSAEGGFDAANILKPALARGEVTLIGATTHEEYRRHILKDKALDRRFQVLTVEEPTAKEAVAMLKGIRSELERHHHVTITEEAIRSAVELSVRYIHDRFLPDKAIDLLDQAATLFAEQHSEDAELTELQDEIALITSQKSEAAFQGEYDLAKELMEKENDLLKILVEREKLKKKHTVAKPVTPHQIAAIVSSRTGIPLEELLHSLEPLNLQRVKKVLESHILGQSEAIQTISQSLMRNQLGLQQKGKPIGSFLLVGPTAVGKTETARVLAREIFGDDRALIKIDMSEYMERHTVSNLVGAPAGYVGFEQGGGLTEQVRRRPYSVVLFDEVEKAHPDVFNLLLQILEDGSITDNTGSHISFEHTLIIMTSNIGMDGFNQAARIGFATEEDEGEGQKRQKEELQDHIGKEIQDYFRPELLGRLSEIIYYNSLGKPVVKKLCQRRISQLRTSLKARGIAVTAEASVLAWLVERYDPEAGARSVDRLFQREVEPAVIAELIANAEATGMALTIEKDKLVAKAS